MHKLPYRDQSLTCYQISTQTNTHQISSGRILYPLSTSSSVSQIWRIYSQRVFKLFQWANTLLRIRLRKINGPFVVFEFWSALERNQRCIIIKHGVTANSLKHFSFFYVFILSSLVPQIAHIACFLIREYQNNIQWDKSTTQHLSQLLFNF